jgi:glucan 1,3-beta-glucosidase
MLLVTMMTSVAIAQSPQTNRLPFIHADGARLVEVSGSPVTMHGCNLGNWLLLEPWMFGGCIEARDQAEIFKTLADRFGVERRDHLLDVYRNGYITPRDFDVIRSFGFNVVRIPFHYSVVQEDAPPYGIKSNAFAHLDRALDMAEAAGVYVILDLHGAPGGQSKDMPTGEVGQNHLWTDPVAQQRTLSLWRAVAQRYHDRSVVAAYDLLNEPYGDFKQNLRPDLVKLVSSLYTTIREVDDQHVMFAPGPIQKGISFYGSPQEHGWHDVGFTEHYYPGLFGSKTVVESHATLLTKTFDERKDYLDRFGAPYYIGEFNVVFRSVGGNRMMREYFDRIAANGWTGTMWSYKLLNARGHEGSGCLVRRDQPQPTPSARPAQQFV